MSDEFWSAREQFGVIRDVARGRLVGPWAVLGGVLALVCSRVGPHVVLPPIVGGVASLNFFVGLAGPSGAGKDAAIAVAQELLYLNDSVPTHEVGTGQGLDAAYTAKPAKQAAFQYCDSALWTLTEVDTLAAHAAMGGSNIMATLRKVYSGSALGAHYADPSKRRPVGAHRYRAALIAGIQPARAGVLLNDADGGTPQRWLWLPANDPWAFEQEIPPVEPFDPAVGALWTRQDWHAPIGDTGGLDKVGERPRHELVVPDAARAAIAEARRERLTVDLTAEPGELNGHALLTRLKVAALLTILCRGEDKITEEDWVLAGVVMTVSDTTRGVCVAAVAETSRRGNAAKAHAESDRDDIRTERAVKATARAILARLRRGSISGWLRRGVVYRDLNSRYRENFDAALVHLISAGQVEQESGRSRDGTEPEELYRAVSQ